MRCERSGGLVSGLVVRAGTRGRGRVIATARREGVPARTLANSRMASQIRRRSHAV
jgi:hypothetical protein